MKYRCGYVSVVGRANAGKSTLINRVVGEKVAIVSNKPQTTRNNILGIKTGEDYQLILVDTPGIHISKNHLDRFMNKSVRTALVGVDLIVYLIDGSKFTDEDEKHYIEKLKSGEIPVITVLTKSDKPLKSDFKADFIISSLSGDNIENLIEKMIEFLPEYSEKKPIYDEDYYTDKNLKFLVVENIREVALKILQKEIPHGIAVEIIRFEEKESLTIIEADIICEKFSHKGIIIGKGGKTLKVIGQQARNECEKLIGNKILLKLFVKVEEDWRNKPNQLSSFGYNDKN